MEMPTIDWVHPGHFANDSEALNQNGWFEKIQKLHMENEKLHIELEESVTVQKHGPVFWTVIVMIIIVAFVLIGLISYNIYITDRKRKRAEIMRAGLQEMQCYEEVGLDRTIQKLRRNTELRVLNNYRRFQNTWALQTLSRSAPKKMDSRKSR